MKNCKRSRAKLLTEKLKKFLEADNKSYDYFLYIPKEYVLEEAQLCQVTAKQGNQVKFNILETDLGDNDELAPTGYIEKENCTGKLGKLGQWEYIESPDFDHAYAYRLTGPIAIDIDGQGKCEDIETEVTPGDPGDYWTPPTGDEVGFSCGDPQNKSKYKSCDIDSCPNGPIYFMQFGITANVEDRMVEEASENYDPDDYIDSGYDAWRDEQMMKGE